MASSWLTMRLITSMSGCRAALSGASAMASMRIRSTVSGVRSSWATSAVRSRWARKPRSSRSSASLTARTMGAISCGMPSSGRRTSIRLGVMAPASCEARRIGARARRTMTMSAASSSSSSETLSQADLGQ